MIKTPLKVSLRLLCGIVFLVLTPSLVGCAGPSSPFGSIEAVAPRSTAQKKAHDAPTYVDVPASLTQPQRQVFRKPNKKQKVASERARTDTFDDVLMPMDQTPGTMQASKRAKSPKIRQPTSITTPSEKPMVARVEIVNPPPAPTPLQAMAQAKPRMEFYPERQVLHAARTWKVTVRDIQDENPRQYLKVYYNGLDVTRSVLKQADVKFENHELEVSFPKLRLPFDRKNNISVVYNSPTVSKVRGTYLPPTCSMYDRHEITQTSPYKPPRSYLDSIHRYSREYSLNPAMMAGIVAQESAFNPEAVSWAKAIGLTQVTPGAETEVTEDLTHFPRYPKLNDLSWIEIRSLIAKGRANSRNEWRLNPYQSIEGGLAYLRKVDEFWRLPQNSDELRQLSGNPYVVYSQIVLASYNSGPTRVRRAISRHGNNWILDSELKEAHKYVNRISSFCYHFSKPEEI